MRVKVERCSKGFRLTMPNGGREFISYQDNHGDWWCRAYATQALNLLENVYGYARRAISFKRCH